MNEDEAGGENKKQSNLLDCLKWEELYVSWWFVWLPLVVRVGLHNGRLLGL